MCYDIAAGVKKCEQFTLSLAGEWGLGGQCELARFPERF